MYRQAKEIEHPYIVPSYSSCYESLLQQQELIDQARDMEASARDIPKQFQDIAASGVPIPSTTLFRKAVLSVKRGKEMFSIEQLTKVAVVLMGKLPYILFRPKSDTKDYVILLFWATSIDDSACEVQKNIQVVKQEISVDGFQLRFVVENVPWPRHQVLYLVNNYTCLKTQNDDACHLPPDNHEQLEIFLKLLGSEPSKKHKTVDN